jgi:hypothetical protein
MRKAIYIQTQPLDSPRISPVKEVGFIALNFDNIKLVIDGYNGFPCLNEPRTDSLVEIMDEKEVFQLLPETLLAAIRFYWTYNTAGNEIVRYKNKYQVIMPDRYKNAQKAKNGLKV